MSFEQNPSILRINGKIFDANEQDVYEILGLPIDEGEVEFVETTDVIKRRHSWDSLFF